jgi:hypothetical protein
MQVDASEADLTQLLESLADDFQDREWFVGGPTPEQTEQAEQHAAAERQVGAPAAR